MMRKVRNLSYEIRTSDGTKVMENRTIKNLETGSDGYLRTEIEISGLLMNQEYSFQITLWTNHGDVYYYTSSFKIWQLIQNSMRNCE